MNRRNVLLTLGLGVIVGILTVPARQVFATKSKEATVTLEIRGMV
jgi:hypothetical protein